MLLQPVIYGGHMDWHAITFKDADEPQEKIKHVFLKHFTTSGSQEGMGVFAEKVPKLGGTTFYFTPAAVAIAKIFRATQCNRPPRDNLKLLFGPDTCWNLFPA